VQYPPDVPISNTLRHVLDCMLIKVRVWACVRVCARARACVRRACMHACVPRASSPPVPTTLPAAPARRARTQDPQQRITLPELMTHPWTTLGGKFPLKSTHTLAAGETQEVHPSNAQGATFAQVGCWGWG